MLLKEIVERKNFAFYESAENWKDAIRKSCRPLAENGAIQIEYAERVIECIEIYGPYIVILPGVAMPHCNEGCELANSTVIGFTKFNKEVVFDADEDKKATLLFTLAATDPEKHLENLQKLSAMLENDMILECLFRAESEGDLLRIDNYMEKL